VLVFLLVFLFLTNWNSTKCTINIKDGGGKKMYKCCSCGKEFDPNKYVPDTCECGGGVVEARDQNHFDWMSEYDSDGF
jgi:hypothetical protein